MNRKGSAAVIILLIVVILIVVGFWYFSEKPSSNIPSTATSQVTPTGNLISNTSFLIEYQTPYGYKFNYPNTFRLADDYTNLINRVTGQGHLTLTMASQDQEDSYVTQVSSSISQYTSSGLLMLPDFFVNQSIFIGIAPGSFSDLATPITKLANTSSSGHQLPASITDLESVSTQDGVNGIIYVYQDNFPLSSSTPLSVRADLPYQPKSLKAGVDYTAPAVIEFSFPIIATSSVSSSEATLQQIINSLEFD